jgi:hypothetical protein
MSIGGATISVEIIDVCRNSVSVLGRLNPNSNISIARMKALDAMSQIAFRGRNAICLISRLIILLLRSKPQDEMIMNKDFGRTGPTLSGIQFPRYSG